LFAIALIGGRDGQRQQVTERIDRMWTFDSLRRLAPS
jgi:hypothetical protein